MSWFHISIVSGFIAAIFASLSSYGILTDQVNHTKTAWEIGLTVLTSLAAIRSAIMEVAERIKKEK